jgi:hypothetical protein
MKPPIVLTHTGSTAIPERWLHLQNQAVLILARAAIDGWVVFGMVGTRVALEKHYGADFALAEAFFESACAGCADLEIKTLTEEIEALPAGGEKALAKKLRVLRLQTKNDEVFERALETVCVNDASGPTQEVFTAWQDPRAESLIN